MGQWRLAGYILAEIAQTLIFFGLGAACLGVSLEAMLEHNYAFFVADALDTDNIFTTSAYLLMVGGAFLILLGFFGPVVVCINKPAAFYVLAVVQVLVGLLILLGGILSGITRIEFRDEQMHEQGEEMGILVRDHYGSTETKYDVDFTDHWNRLQEKQRCCGNRDSSWSVFKGTTWWENAPGTPEVDRPYVPESCCVQDRERHDYLNLGKCQHYEGGPPKLIQGPNEFVYHRGCNKALRDFMWDYTRHFMGLGFAGGLYAIFSVILPIFLGCWLSRSNRKDEVDKTVMMQGGTPNVTYPNQSSYNNYGYYQGRQQQLMHPPQGHRHYSPNYSQQSSQA